MQNHFLIDCLYQMQRAGTHQQVYAIGESILRKFNIQNFKYLWQPCPHILQAPQQSVSCCPEAWMRHYREKQYADIDPKFQSANKSRKTLVCNAYELIKKSDTTTQPFWNDSINFGLQHGITIPIKSHLGGDGMLCISLPSNASCRKDTLHHLSLFEILAHHLQINIERLLIDSNTDIKMLSIREIEVLKWTAYGKTADETAKILSISYTTVLFHLNNARKKLNASNKHQLTARAIALGII